MLASFRLPLLQRSPLALTNAHDMDLRCLVVDVVEHDVAARAEHDGANVGIRAHLRARSELGCAAMFSNACFSSSWNRLGAAGRFLCHHITIAATSVAASAARNTVYAAATRRALRPRAKA